MFPGTGAFPTRSIARAESGRFREPTLPAQTLKGSAIAGPFAFSAGRAAARPAEKKETSDGPQMLLCFLN